MREFLKKSRRQLSSILFGEDSLERACREIPESSCHERKYNTTLNVANGAVTKLAEQLAGPNLVLVWLLQVIGSPMWMLGFLAPIKQTASLLPQMVIAGQIRRLAVRKWVWVGAALLQTACLLLMLLVSGICTATVAGGAILVLFAVFSMASGTASVAFQDVLGKTVEKGHRGKLLAMRALIGGGLTLLVGGVLSMLKNSGDSLLIIQLLLVVSAILWALGGLLFAMIREDPGATAGARNPISEIGHGLEFFRRYIGFRRFLYARALLLCVELSAPFFFIHASSLGSINPGDIGLLVAVIGLSQLLSSPFWGRMADQTSRQVMEYSAIIAGAAALLALVLAWLPSVVVQKGLYLVVFILIGLAESGVRLGRKTYLVDAVPAQDRATYAALSNCVVGILAMLLGVLGVVAQVLGVSWLIAILGILAMGAALLCRLMPEADAMLGQEVL